MELNFENVIFVLEGAVAQERNGRGLTDSEIAVLYCAWNSISYRKFVEQFELYRDQIKHLFRRTSMTFKHRTLPATSSRLMSTIAQHYEVGAIYKKDFKEKIYKLYNKGKFYTSDSQKFNRFNSETQSLKIETSNKIDEVEIQISASAEVNTTSIFIGRDLEIRTLSEKISEFNLILLSGFPGLGKTTLLDKLGEQLTTSYNYFYTDFGCINSLEEWIVDILSQIEIEYELNSVSVKNAFLKFLETSNSLIVIDSVGQLGQTFSSFLENFCQKKNINSRIIVSSSHRIKLDIPSKYYFQYSLSGLHLEKDVHLFFSHIGLEDPELWMKLCEDYSGNYRELLHVSKFIQDFFSGKVSEYLKLGTKVISLDLSSYFKSINFSNLDLFIFSKIHQQGIMLSEGLMSLLRGESSTSEIALRLNFLVEHGFLRCNKDRNFEILKYSLSPLLEAYLMQEELLDA